MEILRYSKALADETRVRILAVLMERELNVGEIVQALDLPQSRVSHHLGLLAEVGLVQPRRDGLWVFYSAADQGRQREYLQAVSPFLDEGDLARDREAARQVAERRRDETRRFFDAIATDWECFSREVLGDLDLGGRVQALLPECSTAADLGCGDGALLPSLHQRAGRVIGVDHSPGMLRAARQRLGDVDWASLRIGELEHLPLRDAEADAALICMALHHLSHPAEGLTESARTIRPGGTLLVVDFDKHGKEDMRTRHGDRWLGFSEDELAELLREAGLTPLPALAEDLPSGLRLLFQPARKPHEHKET